MVELKTLIPGIVYDLRYATTNNFMHRLMYPSGTAITFMRMPAAQALAEIAGKVAAQISVQALRQPLRVIQTA